MRCISMGNSIFNSWIFGKTLKIVSCFLEIVSFTGSRSFLKKALKSRLIYIYIGSRDLVTLLVRYYNKDFALT
jgi:hypothetical protein